MLQNILIIGGLVIDTFLMTSVNGLTVKENLKSYLGIETAFSIAGFLIGSIVMMYIPVTWFKLFGAGLILLMQLLDIVGYEYPEKVNALLLGADSLIVFSTMNWIYIPILTIMEFVAIMAGSLIGAKIVCKAPGFVREYAGNAVMIIIALTMIL